MDTGPSTSSPLLREVEKKEAQKKKVKQMIEQYYRQLIKGCGNPHCINENCASYKHFVKVLPERAAVKAVELMRNKAQLCFAMNGSIKSSDLKVSASSKNSVDRGKIRINSDEELFPITEVVLMDIIEICQKKGSYSDLVRVLVVSFADLENMGKSFLKHHPDESTDSKEKDEQFKLQVDIDSLRRSFMIIFAIDDKRAIQSIFGALIVLLENMEVKLKFDLKHVKKEWLSIFVILMEIPMEQLSECIELILEPLVLAAAFLPMEFKAILARAWALDSGKHIEEKVRYLQQLITLKVVQENFDKDNIPNDNATVVGCTKFMDMFFYANILGEEPYVGISSSEIPMVNNPLDLSSSSALDFFEMPSTMPGITKYSSPCPDSLGFTMNIGPIDCNTPLIPFNEFYNEALSEAVEVDKDFSMFKTDGRRFSFLNYPYILTPAVKSMGLYYDNRVRMFSERRFTVIQSLMQGRDPNPYLKITVKRDHIIADALIALELAALDNPSNLKKQLFIEFDGEQGFDEGGISKEFFALIIAEIFNPEFGMFTFSTETNQYWFNPTTFENQSQFSLVGMLLGLAIYNNVILDIQFPMVVYRKLMGKIGMFFDLKDLSPILFKSLKELLEYDGNDVEDTFMLTFQISYTDIFGTLVTHDLKENGDKIIVNKENKKEFVDLYADFILNRCISNQFWPFKKGFLMVTGDSPLMLFFRPEELELLVCGSKIFDLNALQNSTEYDNGYTANSETIVRFWEIVHEFDLEQQRKLLQFATGSDKVPVGGLSNVRLIISRHAKDDTRLPTSQTCFNVLFLPEYTSKEILKQRLLVAISYSQGFGMM